MRTRARKRFKVPGSMTSVQLSSSKNLSAQSAKPTSNADSIMHLQCTISQLAVIGLLHSTDFQTKLNIGASGGKYKQGTYTVVQRVVSMPELSMSLITESA